MSHLTQLPPNLCPLLFKAMGSQDTPPRRGSRSRRSVAGLSRPPSC